MATITPGITPAQLAAGAATVDFLDVDRNLVGRCDGVPLPAPPCPCAVTLFARPLGEVTAGFHQLVVQVGSCDVAPAFAQVHGTVGTMSSNAATITPGATAAQLAAGTATVDFLDVDRNLVGRCDGVPYTPLPTPVPTPSPTPAP